MFEKCTIKLPSTLLERNALEKVRKCFYGFIYAVFPDSNRRSELRLMRDSVSGFRAWTQKLELRNRKVEALVQLLDKNDRKKNVRAGSCVEKGRQFSAFQSSKSMRAKMKKSK